MTSSTLCSIALAGCGSLLVMGAFWLMWMRGVRAAYVDAVWAATTAICGVGLAIGADSPRERKALVVAIALVWGCRLSWHLTARLRGGKIDARYEAIEARYSTRIGWFYAAFFAVQGVVAFVFSLPILAAASGPWPTITSLLGATIVVTAMCLVHVADRQLQTFRKSALKGSICRNGLWRWSRHPNYFFEWCVWCGWAVMSLDGPLWWMGVGGSVLMLTFLLWISGIPHVEREAIRSRGDAYREYQRTTSKFIPWPPKT